MTGSISSIAVGMPGAAEMLLILLVLLLVFGQKTPDVVRTLLRWVARGRKMLRDVAREMDVDIVEPFVEAGKYPERKSRGKHAARLPEPPDDSGSPDAGEKQDKEDVTGGETGKTAPEEPAEIRSESGTENGDGKARAGDSPDSRFKA